MHRLRLILRAAGGILHGRPQSSFALRLAVGLPLFLAGLWLIPCRWCAWDAPAWYAGDAELQEGLARGVERWVDADLSTGHFHTGSDLFNGEWLFGTYMMAGLGYGQTALGRPGVRERHLALLGRCIERLLSPAVRDFDRRMWGEDAIDTLDGDRGHAAYLGYLNLVLGYHRLLDPGSPHAALNDRVSGALAGRLRASPAFILQTYPGEAYPVDNAAVIGSLGLHARATGGGHRDVVDRWVAQCRATWVDPRTGLLIQACEPATGTPTDKPRGSGTALAVYFLSFADPALSRELFDAVRRELAGGLLGFGMIREYPASVPAGRGDIDSGPVVLGYGFSATGFALAGCRMYGAPGLFADLYATADLFGAPARRDGRLEFATGGPLGNALMFALLTARPPDVLPVPGGVK
jgi:hypothetical protein